MIPKSLVPQQVAQILPRVVQKLCRNLWQIKVVPLAVALDFFKMNKTF